MASMMFYKILFALFSLLIAWRDIKTGLVPRIVFIFALPFFFTLRLLLFEKKFLMEYIIGIMAGFIIFMFVYFLTERKLGLADVWYSTLIGLILGPWLWYAAIAISCVVGVIFIKAAKQRQIPFIPCMAFGSIVICILEGVFL